MWSRHKTQVLIDDDGTELEIKKRPKKKYEPNRKKQKTPKRVSPPAMTPEYVDRLMREVPLFADISELLDDPNLVHVRNELCRLQSRMLNGHKLSGRSWRWLDDQKAYKALLKENPPVMTDDDQKVLEIVKRIMVWSDSRCLAVNARLILKAWKA